MLTRAGRSLATLLLAVCVPLQASGQPVGLLPGAGAAAGQDEEALRALGEQYVATQEREDGEAFLALWSPRAPTLERQRGMTRFAFKDTDYRFANVAIDRVRVESDRATLRLIADREVIDSRDTTPDGGRIVRTFRSLMAVVLSCVKEDGVWRVWEEESALRALGEALVNATSDEERERLLAGDERLVSADLRRLLASRADQLYVMQAFDRALSLLRLVERVAIQAGDREGLANAYHNIANILYLKRRFPEALELYQRRLAIEQDLQNHEGQAEAWLGIATTEYSQGDYITALESYERALAIREKGNNHAAIADLLVGIGNVRYLAGDYQPALEAYGRAQVLYGRAYSQALIAMKGPASASFGRAQLTRVLQGVGRVRAAQGDYRAALEAYDRALGLATKAEDRPAEANALASLAEVRYRQGQYELAVALYRKDVELAKALGDGDAMAHALAGIGLVELVRGRPAPAAEAYTQARAAYDAQKDQEGMGRALVGLGYAQADLQQFKDALASYENALAIFTARGRQEEIGRALLGKSMAHAGLDEHDRALDAAERAAAIAATLGHMELTWRAATHVGHANRRLGRADAARAAYETAMNTIERLRREIGEDAEPSFLDDRAEPYLGMVDLAADAGDARGAFTYAERARAQVRSDLLRRSPVTIDKGMSAANRDEERAILREIVSLATQVAKMRGMPKPDPARLALLQDRLAAARERYATFRRRIDETLPHLARWRGEAPPIDGETAATIVSDEATLVLEFAVTDERVHVFALAKAGLTHHLVEIGRKALAARILKALDPAALASRDTWRGPSRDLSDLLLAPVGDELAGKSLVIVIPDGPLWRVPFEALDVPAGRASSAPTTTTTTAAAEPTGETADAAPPAECLIEKTAVSYASSLTAWQYARDANAARATAREITATREVLAFASPAIAPEVLVQFDLRGRERPPEELDQELQTLASVYGPGRHAVHLSTGALEAHLRNEAADYAVLHLALPGALDNASPLFSHVLLAGAGLKSGPTGEGPTGLKSGPTAEGPADPGRDFSRAEAADVSASDDGVLEAWELLSLHTNADLVICSDLEWPAGTLQGAEGITGLSWAWLVAGAPAVVVSRWPTSGAAREVVLAGLHRGLNDAASAAGLRHAQALRDAVLHVMRTPGYDAPLHWAGFMMVGDPD